MNTPQTQKIGVALALTAALLWGVSGAVAAGVFADVSPARVAQARAMLAAAILNPFAWWRGLSARREWPRGSSRSASIWL
jgi:drug/metabolite transporter (DMT)-like permease